ncbi:MAG: transposase [Eubacterium sp.]|jgi:transposase-like protein|nr:transposase [Eubacterium sp.]MCH4005605.1 transposase [Eubacterium sp.]MCH4005801.1 transposase [Eubacterium sp.]MCH4005850.1 transposase [Eubacterium sp.]MCH4006317.1 transposase [Eubacterium sp.]
MARRTNYSPDFKAKLVIEILEGEKTLNEVAASHNLNPNMVRSWKKEFIENAGRVFNERQSEKEIRRKEEDLERDRERMLKTIGQLTLERDFLQDCFRETGYPVPDVDKEKF